MPGFFDFFVFEFDAKIFDKTSHADNFRVIFDNFSDKMASESFHNAGNDDTNTNTDACADFAVAYTGLRKQHLRARGRSCRGGLILLKRWLAQYHLGSFVFQWTEFIIGPAAGAITTACPLRRWSFGHAKG